MTEVNDAAPSVVITGGARAEEARELAERLAAESVASELTMGNPTLWGPEAEAEAAVRLAWTGLARTSRPLLGEIAALRSDLHAEGVDRVVLAGMGGSSLAPEVITAAAGVPLTVLDTTDPGQVADALAGDLSRTVLVVSSKSGSTVETDSHRRIFEAAFEAAGIVASSRIVVVTDPDSPLELTARTAGYRHVFRADPNVGGRYSALTAFGLVPAGLAGADVGALLAEAAAAAPALSRDEASNPALVLAGLLGAALSRGAEKVVFADNESGLPGFADWAEQLIAESTGKDGTGLLPVVVEGIDAPNFADAGDDATTVAVGAPTEAATVAVSGSLGGSFLLWEYATAIAGRLLGINPFDQPDVEAAKKAARSLLDADSDAPTGDPVLVDGAVELYAPGAWQPPAGADLDEAITAFVAATPDQGYLSIQAYLDREQDASASVLRRELARNAGVQTTFGWGPRFLHSTGQYHKGGHQNGAFLQITGVAEEDLEVPERPYTLATLQLAQALGDGQVLAEKGRPLLRVHLTDRLAGLARLVHAVQTVRGADR
ncbi:hypothetical protein [Actinoalloteichus hymeniacidonis]|uniref:Glucose-6-phosphate isomerase n=1 Tax=Actinoalloteichus hymeniacidonis TaxID=340345 RepID=A0AAC9MYN0_9PSEU|nr:hypothetical protein [Actinoalloteichus hymeniacidonis]AOS63152.1 Phosphoglucose isomerase [Actinoalloteichus hymeniacidonis]MBB5908811.1 glucose-6-phosphate isomerase [Actinoalloteichus hymeniacidonis]